VARVRANDVDLHVQQLSPRLRPVAGVAPPTAVFIHGAFIDSLASYYFSLGPVFAAAGFDAVMYDLRGHGRSERPPSGYKLQDFAADLDALLTGLGIETPVHLIGNSFGGTVALDYAVHRPQRTATVTVIESGPATQEWADTMVNALWQATEKLPEDEALASFVAEYGSVASNRGGNPMHDAHIARLGSSAARLINTTSIASDIPASRILTVDQIRSIHCPVLLVNGSEGLVTAQATRLKGMLPECQIAVIPGQKHSVLVEAPDEVCEVVLEWIRSHVRAVPHHRPAGAGS
jgi:pimeloyl-ACP methyl ester carboxylesterase